MTEEASSEALAETHSDEGNQLERVSRRSGERSPSQCRSQDAQEEAISEALAETHSDEGSQLERVSRRSGERSPS